MGIDAEIGWFGRCHFCGPQYVKFCHACGHWMCRRCRKRYLLRTVEAVHTLFAGSQPGCCGVE